MLKIPPVTVKFEWLEDCAKTISGITLLVCPRIYRMCQHVFCEFPQCDVLSHNGYSQFGQNNYSYVLSRSQEG